MSDESVLLLLAELALRMRCDCRVELSERDLEAIKASVRRIIAERDAAWTELAAAHDVLRELASDLGVDGYNADTVDAKLFLKKITDGIDMVVGVESKRRKQAEAELAAMRTRVPQKCGVPTEPGYKWHFDIEQGWRPAEIMGTSNGVLLALIGSVARQLDTMGGEWATLPAPEDAGRRQVPCTAISPHHGDRCDGGKVQSPNPQFTRNCVVCGGTGFVGATLPEPSEARAALGWEGNK